jgi:hypothetical protein
MSSLHGVVIADPSKSSLRFNKIENDHFTVTRKLPGKPQGAFVSEQDRLNNFDRDKEITVPITDTLNLEMIDLLRVRRDNLRADVEKPQLEADKNLRDTDINGGAWFDPKGVNPASFKKTDRPVLRVVRDPASRLANPSDYAKKSHYIYDKDFGNYQEHYYKNNTWKTAKGRVCLFERPFTRIFA